MIKNYIFDFGGVLYEINPKKTLEEFCRISQNKELFNFKNYSYFIQHPVFSEYEKGMISTNEFRNMIKKEFSLRASNSEFDNAWNLTLIGLYTDTVNHIKKFFRYGRVFLLSNTSELHHKKFSPECNELFPLFEKCFFSHQIGLAKPDIKIFKYVIDELKIDKTETLFIDDSPINIEQADIFGLNTFLFDSKKREFPKLI
jgi:glucose-1-phosphatase